MRTIYTVAMTVLFLMGFDAIAAKLDQPTSKPSNNANAESVESEDLGSDASSETSETTEIMNPYVQAMNASTTTSSGGRTTRPNGRTL